MQGSLHQALTLTISGNAFLQGREIGPFWPEAYAFIFCREVLFVEQRPPGSSIYAANPLAWLERLAQLGAGLKLRITPRRDPQISDIMSVGLASGGPRLLLEAITPGRASSFWEPLWEVTGDPHDPDPDRRIWSVSYSRVPTEPGPASTAERSLPEISAALAHSFEALADFVDRTAPAEAMPGWATNFRNARRALEREPGHERGDPPPPGFLSSEALRLIRACQAGWVFGGMDRGTMVLTGGRPMRKAPSSANRSLPFSTRPWRLRPTPALGRGEGRIDANRRWSGRARH